jgi:hypothetical protein
MGSKGAGNWYLSCTICDCIRVGLPREGIDMSYRTFVDRDGAYWQVWDSQPTKMERRVTGADRRRHKSHAWNGLERRTGADRRMTSQRRITLAEGYGAGWLTFESLHEKRRLTPIPGRWDELSQPELRTLCEKAKRIAKVDGSRSP